MNRILPFLIILTLVLAAAHFFIFRTATRSYPDGTPWTAVLAMLLAVGLVSIPAGFILSLTKFKKQMKWLSWIGFIWMGFFHLMFFSSLADFVMNMIYPHGFSNWTLYFTFLIGAWALYKGLRAPQLVTHEIQGPAIMQGMTLVQVSDLHVGLLHLNGKWLSRVVDIVNQQRADFFAITGDLVEGSYGEVSPQLEILKTAYAKIDRFYITGNHEYIHGSGPWENRLANLGYTTLHNENKVFNFNNAKILFAGVPDRMVKRFDPRLRSVPDEALKTNEKVDYKILLAHEPASRWDMKIQTCDLILSGHTHGGQIFPFGLLVRLAQPVVSGFKQMGEVLVFAHQGTGLWGPPMRWFSRSEIVLFKWIV